jgi:hypothetical protein
MSERRLVDQLNSIRTDIVLEVRRADTALFNLENGLSEILKEEGGLGKVLGLLAEARKHLAKVTD